MIRKVIFINRNIRTLSQEAFSKYGYIIDFDYTKSENFQVVLNEFDTVGWRIAVSRVTARNVVKLARHPATMESFEPVSGVTLICVAMPDSPEEYEVFLLDKPVCLLKNIWHSIFCLSECSIIKITENVEVSAEHYTLQHQALAIMEG